MISFEKFLISKGYLKFILNCKTMKYELANSHIISSMINLDHRYIHKKDTIILDKIQQGKSIMDDDFSIDCRKNVICVGLRERNKPCTLINPRPKIIVIRERVFSGRKKIVIENESFDDSMNLVLSKESYEEIFKSLFDDSINFRYDLTC